MMLSNPLIVVAMLSAFLGLLFLFFAMLALKRRALFGTVTSVLIAFLLWSLSALFSTLSLAVQGYHALTREELAAIVKVEPAGVQQFTAQFTLPDGSKRVFCLAGDQLYIDARILKWKPLANLFGLHTSYALDRVGGRYARLRDEETKAHTLYALSQDRFLDMFSLRRKMALLAPLLDAEYGSATFVNTERKDEFMLLVSTTGLLIRKVPVP